MNPKNWICYGDSITCCNRFDSASFLGDGYVHQLSVLSRKNHYLCNFYNRGIDGLTLQRLIELVQRDPFLPEADTISVLIGINDIGMMMYTNRTPLQIESMLEQFACRFHTLLSLLTSYHAKVFVIEPFLFPYPEEQISFLPYAEKMNQIIQKTAYDKDCIFLPVQQELLLLADKVGIHHITTDGVHLSPKGQEYLAEKIWNSIIHA